MKLSNLSSTAQSGLLVLLAITVHLAFDTASATAQKSYGVTPKTHEQAAANSTASQEKKILVTVIGVNTSQKLLMVELTPKTKLGSSLAVRLSRESVIEKDGGHEAGIDDIRRGMILQITDPVINRGTLKARRITLLNVADRVRVKGLIQSVNRASRSFVLAVSAVDSPNYGNRLNVRVPGSADIRSMHGERRTFAMVRSRMAVEVEGNRKGNAFIDASLIRLRVECDCQVCTFSCSRNNCDGKCGIEPCSCSKRSRTSGHPNRWNSHGQRGELWRP